MVAPIGRRGFVVGAVGAAALSAGLWPPRPGHAAATMDFDEARHLLSRTTFGATPAEIRALEAQDYGATVDRLLASVRRDAITPPPGWLNEGPAELQRQVQAARAEAAEAKKKAGVDGKPLQAERPLQEQGRELRNWWVEEMLVTDQPLTERMVLFWHNHFTSSLLKVRFPPSLFRQNALFRREALGNFATLLKEVARDPAMLIYLDGMRSVARQPNENFARELLELFTLGEGHYGEADIKAAARAFTGWTVDRQTGHFRTRDNEHDGGEKTFLGQTGRFDGDAIIAILLKHPRTAETIVEKLWREFVSLKPDPAEVRKLAASFRSNYEIKPLMRAILVSAQFRDPANRGGLIKSPVELIVGTVHLLGAAGAGEDPARAHDAGARPDAVRSAQRQGLARRRELDHDLHAAAAPAVPAPHRRGDDRGLDGRGDDVEPAQPAHRAPRAASHEVGRQHHADGGASGRAAAGRGPQPALCR